MEQFVLLIIIAAISLINWILQKSAEHREKRKAERARGETIHPSEAAPQTRPEGQFDGAEQTRKFLEALGLPEDALPPRQQERQPTPPPLPQEPVGQTSGYGEPAPKRNFLHKVDPDLEQRLYPDTPVEARPANRAADRLPTRTRRLPSAAAIVTTSPSSSARDLVEQIITQKDGLRRAILMREILGPPKAVESW